MKTIEVSTPNKKILLIGGKSDIGSNFFKKFSKTLDIDLTSKEKEKGYVLVDLEDVLTFKNLDFSRYDSAIFLAGITNLQYINSNKSKTRLINQKNTSLLMDKLLRKKIFTLFLSSNQVFSGKKDFYSCEDKKDPLSLYGSYKSEVEDYILGHKEKDHAAILRLTKVISNQTRFIKNWKKEYKTNQQVSVFSNRFISPIELEEVLDAMLLIIENRKKGIYQLGGKEYLTYLQYAKEYFPQIKDTNFKLIPSSENDDRLYPPSSLNTNLPTKELQYDDFRNQPDISLGLMTKYAYWNDPKRMGFTFSRYKFVSKMFDGFDSVLEIGCADAFCSTLVMESVKKLEACDFDKMFIKENEKNHPHRSRIKFYYQDLVKNSLPKKYNGIYALDVLEHIEKHEEQKFLTNLSRGLKANGSCIIGMPSLESQKFASEISKLGHVNCKSGEELKSTMKNYFRNVFIFSMNDETLHTGFFPMSHYLLALCINPRIQKN